MRRALVGLEDVVPRALFLAVADGVLSGGKRLRPVLAVAAAEAMAARPNDALYDLAASLELMHAYSLIHDDLPCMDDAPLRRGRPAVHAVRGVRAATLAGAVLIPWAASRAFAAAAALSRSRSQARAVAACLLDAAGAEGMVGGQALDLIAEGRSLAETELEELHGLKTGRLLAAAPEIGARAVNAPPRACRAVRRFGLDLGLAFQVVDDVLDATGSADRLGKRPSDGRRAKSTYVALLGVEGARARAEALAARALRALDDAGLEARRLRQLARFAVDRER